MIRFIEEIQFVHRKVRPLSKTIQFVENQYNCHAEIALLKAAVDHWASNTLYIGASKRPCYCCSLFFKAVAECKNVTFDISIVTTHGKLYPNWKKIDGFLVEEFSRVWATAIAKLVTDKRSNAVQGSDENSSESEYSSDDYDLAQLF